jgi:dihydropteroate synthase
MTLYKINSNDYESLYKTIGTENNGANILAKKSFINTIYIKDLHTGAANILKQDALSIGADLAVPRGTILNTTKTVNAILIASNRHLEILSYKELSQPFGLKNIAKQLKKFICKKKLKLKIMGIINTNDNSFYSKSRFSGKDAINQIDTMIKNGANIIDIGAVSSRPGSKLVSEAEELHRIKNICDIIKKKKIYKKVDFSIDSYTPSVVRYALKSGFKIVNDITGLSNIKIAKLTAKYNASIIIMHMQGDPSTMQNNPQYENIIVQLDYFFKQRIKIAKDAGIKDIILDTGIGFGKTLEHNLELLKNQEHFLHFGYELLIGVSRKSIIENIIPNTPNEQRLSGTLAIHLDSINKGVSIIRCHDVKEHSQAIRVSRLLN